MTNAVVGEADGATVLVELTSPLMGWEGEVVRQVVQKSVRTDDLV